MRVIEIFKSIDGEGLRTGVPVVFVRLEGCNLRCSYCDTKYSYEDAEYSDMTVHEIVTEVLSHGLDKVTLTGGEPLTHPGVAKLVACMIDNGLQVNIETNGSVEISQFHRVLHKLAHLDTTDKIMYTVDYKCYSSLMTGRMDITNIEFLNTLKGNHVLKFVVGGHKDLEQCKAIIEQYSPTAKCYISPVFGAIEPSEIVDYVLSHESMYNCVVQVQLHKIIWDPEVRGV